MFRPTLLTIETRIESVILERMLLQNLYFTEYKIDTSLKKIKKIVGKGVFS